MSLPLLCMHVCVCACMCMHVHMATHTHRHCHLQLRLDGIVKNKLQIQLEVGVEFQVPFVTIYI